jgi:hypothetical protein
MVYVITTLWALVMLLFLAFFSGAAGSNASTSAGNR